MKINDKYPLKVKCHLQNIFLNYFNKDEFYTILVHLKHSEAFEKLINICIKAAAIAARKKKEKPKAEGEMSKRPKGKKHKMSNATTNCDYSNKSSAKR